MESWAWLSRSFADVPPGDDWLGPRERAVLGGLHVEKRRADWRLGRFTAKAAVAAWLGVDVEILAGEDGAPHAFGAEVSLSLSHRAGRALAVVGPPDAAVGCDLELIESRSAAFLSDWFRVDEQALVAGAGDRRDLLANLLWTAKEAAAKARHEGLRLDVRDAAVTLDGASADGSGWHALSVVWHDNPERVAGWWRADDGFVMTVAGSGHGPPVELA